MGKNRTRSRTARPIAPPTLLPLLLAAACTLGGEPDPSEVRRALPAMAPASSPLLEPEVALVSATPASAPAAEVAVDRQAEPARTRVAVGVGRNAAHFVDRELERGFAATCPDLQGSFVPCGDRDGVELLMVGRVDFVLFGGQLSAREQHAGLRQTRLGVELFALAVSPDFPARSLPRPAVRMLLSGEITDWRQLGYDAGPVVVVAPADRALAERAARALIPGDEFVSTAVRVATERHVADQILRERGAIGVVRVPSGPLENGLSLLQIDWAPPTAEAYGFGTYPFGVPLQLVTSGQPVGAAQRFLQFVQSVEGRSLMQRSLLVQP